MRGKKLHLPYVIASTCKRHVTCSWIFVGKNQTFVNDFHEKIFKNIHLLLLAYMYSLDVNKPAKIKADIKDNMYKTHEALLSSRALAPIKQ